VYLKGNGSPDVTAIESFFDASNTVLHLRFVGFADGQSYALVIDYSKFSTRNNTAFTAGIMSFGHNYSILQLIWLDGIYYYYNYFLFFFDSTVMHKCSDSCKSHGTCVTTADGSWICACVANWTGANCDRCADGYHGAGSSCVPNIYCNTSSCNSHGRCVQLKGYSLIADLILVQLLRCSRLSSMFVPLRIHWSSM
jgi:hypothetical protein